ncbi:MAG: DUF4416 family protein [Chitinispirillaceae bacterium]
MAETKAPESVKFFVAILYKEEKHLSDAIERLQQRWGAIEYRSSAAHFDVTDYYKPEMGSPLFRMIITFQPIMPPTELVNMKLHCNEVENVCRRNKKRVVNLDCGYLDHHKIVLASAKEAGQKVYLDKGIWADLAARYKHKHFEPFEWSFPDFKDARYDQIFCEIRARYMKQRRKT